jgi:sporulation protein YlmC with PRC-barrel domain
VSESDPVAWFLIEPGWKVIDSEGNHVGHVEEVEGDPNADIFNGLLISTGLFGGSRYVPAEQIGLITQDGLHLTLNRDEVKRLSGESGSPGH